MDCNDCGHCIDLHRPSLDDPKEVTQTREKIMEIFTKWIKERPL